jgi:hypothetical protein
MNMDLVLALSFSVCLPGVIGFVRFKKINQTYYPFLLLIWLGMVNETVTYFLVKQGKSNAINNNLFYLLESILITYQFKQWGLFDKAKKVYATLLIALLASWTAEIMVFRKPGEFASYFIILHSFVIVFMSISMFNFLLVKEKRKLLKNSIFIICMGLVLFFTCAVLVEAFYLYGLTSSSQFQAAVIGILTFINLLTNLVYALAILWMPRRHGFSLSY